MDTLEQKIINLFKEELHFKDQPLSLDTRIYHDLNCEKEDFEEFLDEYADQFKVDLSEFDLDLHFGYHILTITGTLLLFGLPAVLTILVNSYIWNVGLLFIFLYLFFLLISLNVIFNRISINKLFVKEDKRIPVTIGDLVEAAQTGKWRTPHREKV